MAFNAMMTAAANPGAKADMAIGEYIELEDVTAGEVSAAYDKYGHLGLRQSRCTQPVSFPGDCRFEMIRVYDSGTQWKEGRATLRVAIDMSLRFVLVLQDQDAAAGFGLLRHPGKAPADALIQFG